MQLAEWQEKDNLRRLVKAQRELERRVNLVDYFGGLRVPDLGRCSSEKLTRIFTPEPESNKKETSAAAAL